MELQLKVKLTEVPEVTDIILIALTTLDQIATCCGECGEKAQHAIDKIQAIAAKCGTEFEPAININHQVDAQSLETIASEIEGIINQTIQKRLFQEQRPGGVLHNKQKPVSHQQNWDYQTQLEGSYPNW
jgi:hypothetical protein